MYYLYGFKSNNPPRLVATFDSEQQLLAYVRWATLQSLPGGGGKFEQGSALAGYSRQDHDDRPRTEDDPQGVPHNPSPSML